MKFLATILFLTLGSFGFSQTYSVTDSVMVVGENTSGFNNNSRGFEFTPNTDLYLTHMGRRIPGTTGSYTWVIFESATQAIVHQQSVTLAPNPGVWEYEPISAPVTLNQGTNYILILNHQGTTSAPYYFETNNQVNFNVTYVQMRYCNSCGPTTFPSSTLSNYHYGTPDFLFTTCDGNSTLNINACGSYTLNSQTYTSSGTYSQTIPGGAASGCDSTITLNLVIGGETSITYNESACDSYYYNYNGQTYTSSGFYSDTLVGANMYGCDSIISLNLTIKNSTTSNVNMTVCDSSYTSPSGNYTWTSSGTYYDTIANSAGCDSIMTINLTVGTTSYGTQTETAIDIYTWPLNGQSYTTSGTYVDTTTSASGCDSIVTLNLTVEYTGIEEGMLNDLTIYPNPASDYINVSIPEELLGTKFKIFDNNGKVVFSGKLEQVEMKIEIDDWANGVYILHVNGDFEKSFRIVKE